MTRQAIVTPRAYRLLSGVRPKKASTPSGGGCAGPFKICCWSAGGISSHGGRPDIVIADKRRTIFEAGEGYSHSYKSRYSSSCTSLEVTSVITDWVSLVSSIDSGVRSSERADVLQTTRTAERVLDTDNGIRRRHPHCHTCLALLTAGARTRTFAQRSGQERADRAIQRKYLVDSDAAKHKCPRNSRQ